MKVYLVTSGRYSDYCIECVCATQELAREIAGPAEDPNGEYSGYGAHVEEFTLLTSIDDIEKFTQYLVTIDNDGNEFQRWQHDVVKYGTRDDLEPIEGANQLPAKQGWTAGSTRGFDVALKAARDALAQRKAEEAGIV